MEQYDGNLFVGLFWGIALSLPLWLSIVGWIKWFL